MRGCSKACGGAKGSSTVRGRMHTTFRIGAVLADREKSPEYRSRRGQHTCWLDGTPKQARVQMAREIGTVERFMDDKGFGFIKPDSGGKDVFVHHSAIGGSGFKSLSQGDRVEYDLVLDPKGPRAENVVVVEQ
jgi:cold shock protein